MWPISGYQISVTYSRLRSTRCIPRVYVATCVHTRSLDIEIWYSAENATPWNVIQPRNGKHFPERRKSRKNKVSHFGLNSATLGLYKVSEHSSSSNSVTRTRNKFRRFSPYIFIRLSTNFTTSSARELLGLTKPEVCSSCHEFGPRWERRHVVPAAGVKMKKIRFEPTMEIRDAVLWPEFRRQGGCEMKGY